LRELEEPFERPIEISCFFVVHNEAGRIADAIDATSPFVDEIVVVDQQSTDGTAEIASQLADQFWSDTHHGIPEPSIDLADRLCEGEWILRLDADEILDPQFGAFLRTLVAIAPEHVDGYRLRRVTTIDGREIEDAYHLRLWRRGKATHPGTVHTNSSVPNADDYVSSPAILHHKTRAEQELDDANYALIPGGRPR
jgi:glycosyltransferase involved in cell wall biosynthesis